jgi:phage terminase large subunit
MANHVTKQVAINIPPAFRFLFTPSLFKVLYSGRGCGKTENIARTLIVKSIQSKLRILCVREVQSSIKDSVHSTLKDIINNHGLSDEFEITNHSILCKRTGSEFIFAGLSGQTAISLKSIAAIDYCWCEEANTLSQTSLDTLIPSIRSEHSEIWFSFNTLYESDPVYKMFITNFHYFKPGVAIVKKLTWKDNPYFPKNLMEKMLQEKAQDFEKYLNIWEGECLKHSVAAIFAGKFTVRDFTKEIDEVNWSPLYGSDLGFRDPTTLIKCWVNEDILYIEHELYKPGLVVNEIIQWFDTIPGARNHIIYMDNARPDTISYLKREGYPRVRACQKTKVEDGVEFLRSFHQIVIHPRCVETLNEFKLYSYKVDKRTGLVLPQIEDAHNHCIDAIRYALEPVVKGHLRRKEIEKEEQLELDSIGRIKRYGTVPPAYLSENGYQL